MAQNNHSSNVNGNLKNKPLIKKFMKYFTNTPDNQLLAIDFGKSIHKFFAPGREIRYDDPAKFLMTTRDLFTSGVNDQDLTDEWFVEFLLDKILDDPSMITYDMIADLVESPAYKNYGKQESDRAKQASHFNQKRKFENWLYTESMFARITDIDANGKDKGMNPVEVVINRNGMERVINAFNKANPENIDILNLNQIFQKKIDDKLKEFDEEYINNLDPKALEKLKAIAQDENLDLIDQYKSVFAVLNHDNAGFDANYIDSFTIGSANQTRKTMKEGLGLATNLTLEAVSMRKGWSKNDLKQIVIKYPIEIRDEKFTQQAGQTQEFHYGRDVFKTFGQTLGGAAVMSAISAIPGVGALVGPSIGAGFVILRGFHAGHEAKKAAIAAAKKRGEKLSKWEAAKIGIKAGAAATAASAPYLVAAAAFGKYRIAMRAVGSSFVFFKALSNDIERRAALINQGLEDAEAVSGKPKNFKERLERIRAFASKKVNQLKTVAKNKELGKAVGYAFAKGLASFAGGAIGSEIGSTVGSSIDPVKFKDGFSEKLGKLSVVFGHGHNAETLDDSNEANLGNDITKLSTMESNNADQQESGYEQYQREQLEKYQQYLHDQHDVMQTIEPEVEINPYDQFVKSYIQDHPGAQLDKNGWLMNEQGGYVKISQEALIKYNLDDVEQLKPGQMVGSSDRVFRDLLADETLDKPGNIIKRPVPIIKTPVATNPTTESSVDNWTDIPPRTGDYSVNETTPVTTTISEPVKPVVATESFEDDWINVPPRTGDYKVSETTPETAITPEPVKSDVATESFEDDWINVPPRVGDYGKGDNFTNAMENDPRFAASAVENTSDTMVGDSRYSAPDVEYAVPNTTDVNENFQLTDIDAEPDLTFNPFRPLPKVDLSNLSDLSHLKE